MAAWVALRDVAAGRKAVFCGANARAEPAVSIKVAVASFMVVVVGQYGLVDRIDLLAFDVKKRKEM